MGLIAIYILLAAVVVLISVRASHYIDLLDKKSNILGAFIGGVLLAAATSLPELFTSVSATLFLEKPNPDLVIGNILGSNIFNIFAIASIMVFSMKQFVKSNISKSHKTSMIFVLIINVILGASFLLKFDPMILTVSVISIVILVIYIIGIRTMAKDTSAETQDDDEESNLTVKQIILRFLFMSLLLVASSILLTYTTDKIAVEFNLGATFAGAMFLGIATSLPELSSCIALVKKSNYNAAIGNITGSNLFNLAILFITDIFYVKGSIYSSSGANNLLLGLGFLSSICMFMILVAKDKSQTKKSSKGLYLRYSLASILMYIVFIAMSV